MALGVVELDGVPCYYEWFTQRRKPVVAAICPCCNREIEIGSRVVLLINNYRLFPNILVHEECAAGDVDEVLIRSLKEDYERAVDSLRAAKRWFPDIQEV